MMLVFECSAGIDFKKMCITLCWSLSAIDSEEKSSSCASMYNYNSIILLYIYYIYISEKKKKEKK
jgi:hypothetical protein